MKQLILILLIFLLAACSTNKKTEAIIEQAEKLMEANPDSAMTELKSVKDAERLPKATRMHYDLVMAEAKYRTHTQLMSDSVMNEIVNYYKHKNHGNNLELAKAYFYLGLSYDKNRDPNRALQSFDSAEKAIDTTLGGVAYSLLANIHAYKGLFYNSYNEGRKALQELEKAQRCALLARDTLSAIYYLELEKEPYESVMKKDSALYVCEQSYNLYKKHGYKVYSPNLISYTFDCYLEKGELEKAKHYFDLYMADSLLYDEKGNIKSSMEYAYFIMGKWYYAINNVDSAKFSLYHLMEGSNNFKKDAYHYLYLLYKKNGLKDSTIKYVELYLSKINNRDQEIAKQELLRSPSIFNYKYNETLAKMKSEEAKSAQKLFKWSVVVIGVLTLFSCLVYALEKRKEREHRKKYLQSLAVIEEAQTDIMMLRTEGEEKTMLISEKEKIIERQKEELKKIKEVGKIRNIDESKLFESEIVRKLTKNAAKGIPATVEDMRQLRVAIMEALPGFYNFIASYERSINISEFNTCVLTRLKFKPMDIANLLKISPSYVSKIRINLNKKLFDDEGNSRDFDKNIMQIY